MQSLADQQRGYDQIYGAANQANANAISQAQMEQVRLALAQRGADQQQANYNQSQDFQANQAALDRASHLADVQAQYKGAQQDLFQKKQEQIINDFSKLASNGQMDAATLENYRASLTPENFERAKGILANTLKILGANWQTDNAPQIQSATQSADLASKINSMTPLIAASGSPDLKSSAYPPPSISGLSALNPFSYLARWAGTSQPDTSGIPWQANEIKNRQAALIASSAPGTKTPLVVQDPVSGGYRPNIPMPTPPPYVTNTAPIPPNWAPAFASRTVAPAAPTPPPGAPLVASPSVAPPVLPFPASKDKAVIGSLYQTRAGVRRWDGNHFVNP